MFLPGNVMTKLGRLFGLCYPKATWLFNVCIEWEFVNANPVQLFHLYTKRGKAHSIFLHTFFLSQVFYLFPSCFG